MIGRQARRLTNDTGGIARMSPTPKRYNPQQRRNMRIYGYSLSALALLAAIVVAIAVHWAWSIVAVPLMLTGPILEFSLFLNRLATGQQGD